MSNEVVGAGGAVFIGGAHERVQTGPDHVQLSPEREQVQTGLDHVRPLTIRALFASGTRSVVAFGTRKVPIGCGTWTEQV